MPRDTLDGTINQSISLGAHAAGYTGRYDQSIYQPRRSCRGIHWTVRSINYQPISPLHLFFQCRHTEPVVLGILSWFVDATFRNITRQNFFGVVNMETNHKNILMQLVCALIKKYIWDCKLRFSLPNLGCGKEFLKMN